MTVNVTFGKDIAKAQRKLGLFATNAIPHATRDALNTAAFDARKEWQGEMGKQWTIRSPWIPRSIQVRKATGIDVNRMQAIVGTAQQAVEDQEEGTSIASKGKHGVAIPTPSASGEGMSANPRKRMVQRRSWLSRIALGIRARGNPRQRNAAAIAMAIRSGKRLAFLDLGKRKGIARIMGSKRKPKVRMLWDLSNKSVTLKPKPTLTPTMATMRKRMPGIALGAVNKQVQRIMGRGA